MEGWYANLQAWRAIYAFITDYQKRGGTSNVVFFEVTTPTSAILLSTSGYPCRVSSRLVANEGSTSNNVSILLGNGDPTFRAPVNYATGSNPNSVAVGDFNGDGKLDLAVANSGSNNVSVLLGNGEGTFQAAVRDPCQLPGARRGGGSAGETSSLVISLCATMNSV